MLAALLEQQTALYLIDLIEAEVLCGARDERHAARLAEALKPFHCLNSGRGRSRARLAARYYRFPAERLALRHNRIFEAALRRRTYSDRVDVAYQSPALLIAGYH
jgi:hypothetical protein